VRKRRRQDDDVVYIRIAYHETELREITFRDSKRLGIENRIVETAQEEPSIRRYMPAYGRIY
jgi:hypothetical protein